MNIYKKLALFAGGTLFGSAGIKLLSSKDAKNAYAHTAAAVLRMKDCVMTTVNTVQENAADDLAAAKDIYKRGTTYNYMLTPRMTVTADKSTAYPVTIDGQAYLQQVFTADSEPWVCDYDIDIGFTMPDEVPEGTRIVDMNNNDITKIRTSPNGASYAGQFKVLYP